MRRAGSRAALALLVLGSCIAPGWTEPQAPALVASADGCRCKDQPAPIVVPQGSAGASDAAHGPSRTQEVIGAVASIGGALTGCPILLTLIGQVLSHVVGGISGARTLRARRNPGESP